VKVGEGATAGTGTGSFEKNPQPSRPIKEKEKARGRQEVSRGRKKGKEGSRERGALRTPGAPPVRMTPAKTQEGGGGWKGENWKVHEGTGGEGGVLEPAGRQGIHP